jgi:hypothetical protein
MNRFKILATQNKTFQQLMKENNFKAEGFVDAVDDYFDNTKWEITTTWEDKDKFLAAQQHPYARIFWNRFVREAKIHELDFTAVEVDTGIETKPLLTGSTFNT